MNGYAMGKDGIVHIALNALRRPQFYALATMRSRYPIHYTISGILFIFIYIYAKTG